MIFLDVDVPLTDIQLRHLKLVHHFNTELASYEQGSAEFGLNVDYYNRLLSGWEPLVEPWLARLNWKLKPNSNCFTLTSMDVLNLNITNPFIDLITIVLSNWKDEYSTGSKSIRRHQTFQPYKLLNLTGQSIQFSTFQHTNQTKNRADLDSISSKWLTLDDKAEILFNFNENQNQRSHNSQLRELGQNRLRMKMNEWSEIRPALSVDKVGTYFRDVYWISQGAPAASVTRLIFDISLTGNSTKLIEIKSPVSVRNRLGYKLQCRIEPFYQQVMPRLGPLFTEIECNSEISIPIKYLPCNIWFRPIDLDVNINF